MNMNLILTICLFVKIQKFYNSMMKYFLGYLNVKMNLRILTLKGMKKKEFMDF